MKFPMYLSVDKEEEALVAAKALDKRLNQILRKNLHVVVNNEVEMRKVMHAIGGDWITGELKNRLCVDDASDTTVDERKPCYTPVDLENRIDSLENSVNRYAQKLSDGLLRLKLQIRALKEGV